VLNLVSFLLQLPPDLQDHILEVLERQHVGIILEMKHGTEACTGSIWLRTETLLGSIQGGTEALSGRVRRCLHMIDYMFHVGVTTVVA